MIQIRKNTVNSVVMTLKELTIDCNNTYLMEIISEFDKSKRTIALKTNLSGYQRFDLFEITEGVDLPLSQSVILKTGTYIYNVYEQTDEDNLDVNDDSVSHLVETGRVVVKN